MYYEAHISAFSVWFLQQKNCHTMLIVNGRKTDQFLAEVWETDKTGIRSEKTEL